MRDASESMVTTARGSFRVLRWEGEGTPIVLLHGLTAVAEAWLPTVSRLRTAAPIIAFDQRGHGRSTDDAAHVSARDLANDLLAVLGALGAGRVHLCGHSMGARVAIVAAALYPGRFESVAIVDIGPEAWRQNWVDTVAALDRMRETIAAGEVESIIERRGFEPEMAAAFRARFTVESDGSARPLGHRETMKAIVRNHRSRNYWAEWRALAIPALLIRGEDSDELRPAIAARMRAENSAVGYVEMPRVGHNIPLLEPGGLAGNLDAFWASLA